jgi:alkanesulfonate monooxygenase SsuD/methylene tetrahydromethanopterin reductase-like flavin-dependent oxidoreductase (luciferase family)
VRFSIYSEMQSWPGKSYEQLYAEVLEQIENADRLGFDCYSVIEHFFFPKFSASPDPIALFSAAAQRTKRINFRTLVHVLPYHNPMVLASRIAAADILMGGRYEFGVGRGHGWIPWRAGLPYDEMVGRYDESLEILFQALESGGEPFSYEGRFYEIRDARIVPPPSRRFRVFTGGTSDKTYELAGTSGWGIVVPPLLPYEALREQLDLYRATCAEHGNEPDIVWIHACYLDEDRDTALASTRPGSSRGSPRRRTTR